MSIEIIGSLLLGTGGILVALSTQWGQEIERFPPSRTSRPPGVYWKEPDYLWKGANWIGWAFMLFGLSCLLSLIL